MTPKTINTIDDLLKLLREDEDVRATVRRELLTDELVKLPERFAKYAEATDKRLESIEGQLTQIDGRITQIDGRITQIDGRTRMDRDFGRFRGQFARESVERAATVVAMDLNDARDLALDETTVTVLSRQDLRDMARNWGRLFADVPRDARRSFYEADLVIEVKNADGGTCYIAVETSYTCNSRETTRAIANSGLLASFTGRAAWPVIAGVRVDRRIQPLIDAEDVFWFRLEDRDVRPDEPE